MRGIIYRIRLFKYSYVAKTVVTVFLPIILFFIVNFLDNNDFDFYDIQDFFMQRIYNNLLEKMKERKNQEFIKIFEKYEADFDDFDKVHIIIETVKCNNDSLFTYLVEKKELYKILDGYDLEHIRKENTQAYIYLLTQHPLICDYNTVKFFLQDTNNNYLLDTLGPIFVRCINNNKLLVLCIYYKNLYAFNYFLTYYDTTSLFSTISPCYYEILAEIFSQEEYKDFKKSVLPLINSCPNEDEIIYKAIKNKNLPLFLYYLNSGADFCQKNIVNLITSDDSYKVFLDSLKLYLKDCEYWQEYNALTDSLFDSNQDSVPNLDSNFGDFSDNSMLDSSEDSVYTDSFLKGYLRLPDD